MVGKVGFSALRGERVKGQSSSSRSRPDQAWIKSTFGAKSKSLDTCYSAAYMSQTQEQQRFAISKVAADWHELMIPRCIMWPFIAHANRQLLLGKYFGQVVWLGRSSPK